MDTNNIPEVPPESDARPDVVVHISDLHFGSGFLPKRAEALLDHINQIKPDLAVVSGDLTMRARSEQFKAAREFLTKINAPLLVVPGNHDVPLYDLWKRLTSPFKNYRKYIADLDTSPVNLRNVALFGMNTVNPLKHQQGKFRILEMLELEKWAAAQEDGIWKVAVVHQHFANIPGHERPGVFKHGDLALKRMSKAGINAVLHGHVHYHHVVSSAEFFPTIDPPVALICSGTPTSLRTRGAKPTNNYNVINFYPERFEVHTSDWLPESKAFEMTRQVTFNRDFYRTSSD